MTASKLATGIAALALAGASVVGTAGIASAQQNPGASRCQSANQGGNPGQGQGPGSGTSGQQGTGPAVADENAQRGQQQAASSGCARFAPGRQVEVGVESTYQKLGTTTANEFGEATFSFTVPTNLENGRHEVVFTEVQNTSNQVRVGFTVAGGPRSGAAAQGSNNQASNNQASNNRTGVAGAQLPRTGPEVLIPLGIGGAVLVATGAGMVVAARRRRESVPGGLA